MIVNYTIKLFVLYHRFLGINLTRLFWHQRGFHLLREQKMNQCELFLKTTAKRYQLLTRSAAATEHMLFVITVNITSYESLIVYYCKYIWSLLKSSPYKIEFCRASSSRCDCTWDLLLHLHFYCWVYLKKKTPVKSEINKC